MATKFSIIACRVFEDELERFLPELATPPLEVKYFDVSLHIQPNLMRSTLQGLLDGLGEGAEYALLLCGLCGNAVLNIKSEKFRLVIPRMHECIAMFLGSNEEYMKLKSENPRAYFASPGWLKSELLPGRAIYEATREMYMEKYGDDEETVSELMDAFLEQYASYDNYLYADFFGCAECKKKCMENAEFMKWKFAARGGDPAFFIDAINCRWDKRFLILDKGAEILPSYDERIFNG